MRQAAIQVFSCRHRLYCADARRNCLAGGGGYIDSRVVRDLSYAGLAVRATVRRTCDAKTISQLQELGAAYPGMLQFFETDLLTDRIFAEAMQGCESVMHMASPCVVSGVSATCGADFQRRLDGRR
jgi:UDP-glucose 4-epimerase